MSFGNITPPRLPSPPEQYDRSYMDNLLRVLRLFFNSQAAVQPFNVAKLNINLDTLPTQADLADLRTGDVYRDTTAGDVLKVKT